MDSKSNYETKHVTRKSNPLVRSSGTRTPKMAYQQACGVAVKFLSSSDGQVAQQGGGGVAAGVLF